MPVPCRSATLTLAAAQGSDVPLQRRQGRVSGLLLAAGKGRPGRDIRCPDLAVAKRPAGVVLRRKPSGLSKYAAAVRRIR